MEGEERRLLALRGRLAPSRARVGEAEGVAVGYAQGYKIAVERGGVKAALIAAERRNLPLAKLVYSANGYRVLALISLEDLSQLWEKLNGRPSLFQPLAALRHPRG